MQAKQVVRRSRRTRGRDFRNKQRPLLERPKTATLPRPKVLDESLKDKLDMTLTKKELLAAVKLCSDAAVQRGLPNMRPRFSHEHFYSVCFFCCCKKLVICLESNLRTMTSDQEDGTIFLFLSATHALVSEP